MLIFSSAHEKQGQKGNKSFIDDEPGLDSSFPSSLIEGGVRPASMSPTRREPNFGNQPKCGPEPSFLFDFFAKINKSYLVRRLQRPSPNAPNCFALQHCTDVF
jgi:hypothetical protein